MRVVMISKLPTGWTVIPGGGWRKAISLTIYFLEILFLGDLEGNQFQSE